MTTDAVSSTPTVSTPAVRRRWDVFLSFRGEDTRVTFTDCLYTRLQHKGVRAFRDNEGLNRGDKIDRCLLDAIEDSAAFIAIISPNYANSRWCLEELAKVCECNRLILPVFYNVDPSHVRGQRGPFLQHFKDLEARFGEEDVSKWRKAMKYVGGLAGFVVNGFGDEADVIQTLLNNVLAELSKWSGVAAFTVGLDSRVEEVLELLDLKSNSIRVLGLHGPGGVGKSTLAKALYNKLVAHFENRSFISNVKKYLAQENGLLSLQIKLIGDLSGMASHVNEVNAGLVAIKSIVQEKRVLIILDDVDDASQLTAIAGRKKWRKWFYEGSRIIITTRDREVLHELHENELYEVKQLNSPESLQLFSHYALGRVKPTPDFLPLSKQIVSLTGGLPLALEVFGSSLYDKRKIEEWEDALQKLKQIRPMDLQGVLKISYDGLDEQEKCIFLDIACLFIKMGMKKEDAIDILKGCGFRAEIGIKVLVDKSLLKIAEDYTLWMHDQLRDMGRQIVLHENHEDLGMRSRLWDRSEILRVLQNNLGSRCIQGMVLDFVSDIFMKDSSAAWGRFRGTPNFTTAVTWLKETYKEYFQHAAEKERELILQTKSFESMINLRLLQIDNVQLEGEFKLMPAELKWLQWRGCPLKTLPSDFCPQGLRVLDLSESKNIERLWGCRRWSWHNNKV
ncbi:TMV resistance protein N [Vitis vinifera]|uniref:TMV resistance protein N n=1 Tax=Vitis vinifera TaxID=29760 RepID=A0A438JNN4_VITVI|nr:TMV resistance protein N [Vitis vinifera]